MTDHEKKVILSQIVRDFVVYKDRKAAVEKLAFELDPIEIYTIETDKMITDCYFAIKHLLEEGFETTYAELQYFYECFNGVRNYNLKEKNNYILEYLKK